MLGYINEQQVREVVGIGKEFLIQRLQLLKHIIREIGRSRPNLVRRLGLSGRKCGGYSTLADARFLERQQFRGLPRRTTRIRKEQSGRFSLVV
jgi:hypothetical protein